MKMKLKDALIYGLVAVITMPGAMYLFLRILHLEIFLSAFLSSGLAWLLFKAVSWFLSTRPDSSTAPRSGKGADPQNESNM